MSDSLLMRDKLGILSALPSIVPSVLVATVARFFRHSAAILLKKVHTERKNSSTLVFAIKRTKIGVRHCYLQYFSTTFKQSSGIFRYLATVSVALVPEIVYKNYLFLL